jgi:acetophenone carboxylase
LASLVPVEDITGIDPDADKQQVRLAIKSLLDKGIRRINISLKGAFPEGSTETRVVEISGRTTRTTSSAPSRRRGDASPGRQHPDHREPDQRPCASVAGVDAVPAEEIVRDQHGWQGNVLIGHINGGVALSARPRHSTPSCPVRCSAPTPALRPGPSTATAS